MPTKINDLNKFFGDFQALKDINLTTEEGEFIAILGPSGCGKTTLLRLLAGFTSPTDGEIYMDDVLVGNNKNSVPPEKRNLNMVFQSFALWPHMNVGDHIKFALQHHRHMKRLSGAALDERIDEVLSIVGLEAFKNRLPGDLSGGQKQRVSLARAIAPKPKLLLMDEPLSNLDAELRIEMRREIQNIHNITEASIIYVTHDQGEALAMADRIIVMNEGRIEQIGRPEEIYSNPATPFVATFVGKANLFKGEWKDDGFQPENTDLIWHNSNISEDFMKAGIYPLRPEQISLAKSEGGMLKGTVMTKQFQGKEYHYSVDVNGQTVIVHLPLRENYEIGEIVSIEPNPN
ncbi:ABC transporter ATP-binding protein [Salinicoccus kekensis]|uniref:Iron(III) transport system ATP-binding protein n=1 Tax=Salinicoccus kekensis TaxID=714307 RepID=A0A285UH44_9STAP|nr:ABC transporter ATP-binding protein [Salinicoccus kekensis]SOC41083.1 iron(III) transport system ATP-binding protein [Salinicoccus kekensis]